MNYWTAPIVDIYKKFGSSYEGIDSSYVSRFIKKYGKNNIEQRHRKTPFTILIAQFTNPLIIILILVSVISFWTKDSVNALVIIIMISVNAVLGFTQELRALKSLEKLKRLLVVRSKVMRNGVVSFVSTNMIVPGDIVILNKGDYIPADIRLIESSNLVVSEAALTGESVNICKYADNIPIAFEPQDISNSVFQGTYIVEGHAKGIVVATGKQTFLGKTVELGEESDDRTNFAKKLAQFTNILFLFVLGITVVVVVINVSLGRDLLTSFILGVTLALGITPETMPVILSIALSRAAYHLSKKKLLIKRLNVFEDLGNVDVICSDKTGTITTGVLTPEYFLDAQLKDSKDIYEVSLLCNAYNPILSFKVLPNPIDEAIWNLKKNWKAKLKSYEVVKVYDFDFETRMMGITYRDNNTVKTVFKGAYEEMIERCDIADKKKELILDALRLYEERGYRIIAIAETGSRKLPEKLSRLKQLTLLGFVLLVDYPRDNMNRVFGRLKKLSIELKIITGDSVEVTREICKKVGLDIFNDRIYTGEELERIHKKSLQEFRKIINEHNVFARVAPQQKLLIVQAIKDSEHVVGYIGDGINDVGALKIADVGISVENGADVAKDCADIIILERKLDTVINGVIEGRKIFNNTMKFIFSTMSSSFGNVITITFASLLLKFLPLLPLQVILLDSVTDFQHLAISTDNVDEELLDKPRNWDMKIFTEYSVFWGVVSTVFDVTHIIIFTILTNSPELFRTTWMLESVLTELIATFSIRTAKPFYKSSPSRLLALFSFIPVLFILLLSYSSDASFIFGMVPLPAWIVLVVVVLVSVYLLALEILKRRYFERFWGVQKNN